MTGAVVRRIEPVQSFARPVFGWWLLAAATTLACSVPGGSADDSNPSTDGSGSEPSTEDADGMSEPQGSGGVTALGSGGSANGTGAEGGDTQVPREPGELELACEERAGTLSIGLTKLRRLTRRQLDNTLVQLLGVEGGAAIGLAPDERLGPFESNAITPITALLVEQIQEMAKRVAAQASPRREEIMGCDSASDPDCARAFIQRFGKKAYRRPLTQEESDGFLLIHELGASNADADQAFSLMIQAFVQSPSFLYHADVPATELATAVPAPTSAYTLASRLSYFLWNSMPDDTLFALAEDGTLSNAAVLSAEITRMLEDERAADTIGVFHEQWLGVTGLEEKTKDLEKYPSWGSALATSMLDELRRFSAHVVRDGDGLLSTLLTADFTLPDEQLLALYGVAEPAGFNLGDKVTVPHRSGILTQPAFLAKNSHMDQTSVVHRGLIVRKNLLCQTVQPPPSNVSTSLPPPTEATTTRERLEQHLASPACAQCHQNIDPLGYAFEHYDPIGAYRTEDGLGPVDASGEFVNTSEDLQGNYDDAAQMLSMMADSREVQDCVADQWLRFALGRMESLDDACTLLALHQEFQASGGDLPLLIERIATSDAFLNVRSTTEVSP